MREGGTPASELRTRTRIGHLAIAFAVALLLTALVTDLIRSPALALVYLPFFAEGLVFSNRFSWWGIIAGWAVYLALAIVLLRAADRRRYRVLLVVLCVLLLINIAGCHNIASHIDPGHGI